MFFLGRLVRGGAGFRIGRDVAVRVEGANCPVAFLEYVAAFFKKRLDLFYEPFFIEFFFGSAICAFDVLKWC